jgi:hypothetical protein
MDLAAWEQQTADAKSQEAESYLAAGDLDNAEYYAASAEAHQATADYHGDLGEHGGEMAVYDASSVVETGGSYEAHDYSSTDYSAE